MSTDTATVTERVAAGAALLDDVDPGWWEAGAERAVDLGRLDMEDARHCVLGQRCPPGIRDRHRSGPYWAWACELSGAGPAGLRAVGRWAAPLGFACGGPCAADCACEDLTAEWKRVISGRRAAA